MEAFNLYLQAGLYTMAGLMHFLYPRFFIRIIPPALPNPKALNLIAGGAEILLGLGLLFPLTRSWAAWGLILLLIAVFPANIYQAMTKEARMKVPAWLLWLRLPLQFVLIYWVYLLV